MVTNTLPNVTYRFTIVNFIKVRLSSFEKLSVAAKKFCELANI